MNNLLQKLSGDDRRSIGRSDEVAAQVLADLALFPLVFEGLRSDDPLIRMRAADAVEKITTHHPEYLQPYKNQLMEQVAPINQIADRINPNRQSGHAKPGAKAPTAVESKVTRGVTWGMKLCQ